MQTIDVNGAQLGYVEAGSGEPPIVFVHGWCCDHTFFAPQAEHFSTDRRCVSLDLRGRHGPDGSSGSATIPTHAADVVGFCEELEIERPIIAGHSMGGAVALAVAAQSPTLPAGLALVDPALIPSEEAAQMEGFVAALESPDYQTAARGFIEQTLFMPTDDEAVRTRVTDVMLDAPQDVMVSEMKSTAEWWNDSRQHTWTLPVMAILSGQTIVDPESLGERCTNLETVNTPGVGHFNQLLAPDAVNDAMEQLLARV